MAAPKAPKTIAISSRAAAREAADNFKRDNRVREQSKSLLSPDEVAGEYDVKRGLLTTLGGQMRPMTFEDIKQFRHLVGKLGRKYKGGITAKQVIDFSLKIDRDRAAAQIKTAFPVSSRGSLVKFVTNAGPDSDRTRHYVDVEFLNFEAVVASPQHAGKIVQELRGGKLKLNCDCGRWRFWYRFIATAGQYATQVTESAYPKIRNPSLNGVACKHILRVMTVVGQSPTFKGYAEGLINQARKSVVRQQSNVTLAQQKEQLERMRGERSDKRRIQTTNEKNLVKARAAKARKALGEVQVKAKVKAQQKAKMQAPKPDSTVLRNLMSMGFNEVQAKAMLAAAKNTR